MSGYAVVSFKRTCLSIWCFIEICVFGWNVLCKIRRESTPSLSRLWTRVIYIFRLLCLLINREACLLRLLSVHPWRHGCLIKLTQSTWKLDFISCFSWLQNDFGKSHAKYLFFTRVSHTIFVIVLHHECPVSLSTKPCPTKLYRIYL